MRRGPALPLAFEPGTEWLYSVATDVLGRLVEIWSGQPLDEFLPTQIFSPLDMPDTGFLVPEPDHDRLAALYAMAPGLPEKVRYDALGEPYKHVRRSGSPAAAAWCRQSATTCASPDAAAAEASWTARGCCRRGRSATCARNHLPGGADLAAFGRPLFAETRTTASASGSASP